MKENEEGVNAFQESPATLFENTSVDVNLSSENVDCSIDTVGSIDSVADVGKSCLELTPSGRRRSVVYTYMCFIFKPNSPGNH